MTFMIGTFARPEDITDPGFDGKVFRFPVALIDRDDIGTPRQLAKTKSVRIRVEVSDSRIKTWGLGQNDLVKVLFEIANKHLTETLSASTCSGSDLDLRVVVNFRSHEGPCSFDPALIQEPDGAVVEIEIKRPMGFI